MKPLQSLRQHWTLWVWQHTPDCAEMSRLASRRLDQPLPFRLRWKMRLHFLICVWCERYSKQLAFLHRHLGGIDQHPAAYLQRGLSADARRRIVQQLRVNPGA